MKPAFTTAMGIVVAGCFIAIAILLTQPRYEVIEVQQSFNNGFGAWRLDVRSGKMHLCSATPGGLICSNPAIELEDQDEPVASAPVAVEQPEEEESEE